MTDRQHTLRSQKLKTPRAAALADIAGKRIAVILGTTAEKVMAELLQKANIEVELIRVRKHSDGIAALENGTVNAYASDRVLLIGLALMSKEPTKLVLADQYLSGEGAIHEHADGAYRLLTRSDL